MINLLIPMIQSVLAYKEDLGSSKLSPRIARALATSVVECKPEPYWNLVNALGIVLAKETPYGANDHTLDHYKLFRNLVAVHESFLAPQDDQRFAITRVGPAKWVWYNHLLS